MKLWRETNKAVISVEVNNREKGISRKMCTVLLRNDIRVNVGVLKIHGIMCDEVP
jgi:hypothetical protein